MIVKLHFTVYFFPELIIIDILLGVLRCTRNIGWPFVADELLSEFERGSIVIQFGRANSYQHEKKFIFCQKLTVYAVSNFQAASERFELKFSEDRYKG